MNYTIQDLAYAKGTSAPVREALLSLEARVNTLEAALKAISEDVHAPCVRLLIHPSMCKRAYEAKRALESQNEH